MRIWERGKYCRLERACAQNSCDQPEKLELTSVVIHFLDLVRGPDLGPAMAGVAVVVVLHLHGDELHFSAINDWFRASRSTRHESVRSPKTTEPDMTTAAATALFLVVPRGTYLTPN